MRFKIIIVKMNKFNTVLRKINVKSPNNMYYFHINQFRNNWDEEFLKHQTPAV